MLSLTIYGNVDPLSGDLRHDGDVRVFGSVLPGSQIVATGDLLVTRDVRDAVLVAGGDLTVNGLVAGETTVLDVLGSVLVRQAVDVKVLAGLDIRIRAAADRCDLSAGRRIVVYDSPALLRGGTCRARVGVEARRIDASAGRPARIEIGRPPFPETEKDLLDRLDFARKRSRVTSFASSDPARAFRRNSDAFTWRTLAAALERKLTRLRRSAANRQPPYLRVSGPGPVRAEVTLGPVRNALAGGREQQEGAFVAVLEGTEVRARAIEETTCVG